MPSIDFIKEIQENDRKTFFKDFENSKKYSQLVSDEEVSNKSSNSRPLISDFTEYSPFDGLSYKGKATMTIVNGEVVMENDILI